LYKRVPVKKLPVFSAIRFQIIIGTCSVADPDPVTFYPKDPGSGSGMIFFPDPGSRILTTSQIQDFTFKNGEQQEKLNFFLNMTSILTFSCMKKVNLIFPFSYL
jgi:hypothetical protein